MSTIDEQFIEFIVKTLVSNPDAVSINRTIDEKGVLLELTVDQEDLGRVIGKRGSGAQALRTLLRALGTKNDARYNLKIVDVGDGSYRQKREERTEDQDEPTEVESTEERDDEQVAESNDEVSEDSSQTDETDDTDEDDSSSKAARTRQELADLDDLDI